MNWKLIVQLSLFGLAMGIATVFWIPSNVEPLFWLVILGVTAYLIARSETRPFQTGLLVGIANSVWVTGSHVSLFSQYIAHHPKEAAMMGAMPLPDSPRLMMVLVGAGIGVVSGLLIGCVAWLAREVMGREAAASATV